MRLSTLRSAQALASRSSGANVGASSLMVGQAVIGSRTDPMHP
jgi:hypothetical protein